MVQVGLQCARQFDQAALRSGLVPQSTLDHLIVTLDNIIDLELTRLIVFKRKLD